MTPRPASFVARVVFLAPLAWSVSTARAADPDPGKPNIAHNYARAHNDMVERVSESRRAYPLYKQGDSLLKPWKGGPGGAPVTDAPSPGQHNWDAVVAWVTENAEAAGVIRDAASRDTLDVPWISPNRVNKTGKPDENPTLIKVLRPQIEMAYRFSVLLRADARVAITQGDAQRWTDDVRALIGLGEQLVGRGFANEQVMGYSALSTAVDEIKFIVATAHTLPREDDLSVILTQFISLARSGHISPNLEADTLAAQDAIQRSYSGTGGDTAPLANGGVMLLSDFVPDLAKEVNACEDDTELLKLYERIRSKTALRGDVERMQESLRDAMHAATLNPSWMQTFSAWRRVMGQIRKETPKYAVLEISTPDAVRICLLSDLARVQVDVATILIRLERYRREHDGAFPASLDALTEGTDESLPDDRLSGKAFLYKLVDGRPMLYSAGVDRDDDGGKPYATPGNGGAFPPGEWWTEPEPENRPDGDFVLFFMPPHEAPLSPSTTPAK